MYNKLSLALAVAATSCVCLITGCSSPSDQYYPLDSGWYWRYTMTYHTMDGNFKGMYAVENLGRKQTGTQQIYVRRLLDGSSEFLRLDGEGIHVTGREKSNGERVDIVHAVFRFPLVAGTEWQDTTIARALIKTGPPQKTEFHINALVPVTAKIMSMTDAVSVPAGDFTDCMRIFLKGSAFTDAGNYVGLTVVNIEQTDWYAPGVGLVKSVRKEATASKVLNRGEVILELEEYRR